MELPISLTNLLNLRSFYNLPIFSSILPTKEARVVINHEGLILYSDVSQNEPEYSRILPYTNKPIMFYDKRATSVNFSDSSSWPAINDSSSLILPDVNKKFVVTNIQVRFPKNVRLTPENRLIYEVWLYVDAYQSVVKAISITYNSLKELFKKTSNPLMPSTDIVTDLSTDKLVEVRFDYADPFTLKGSPVVLSSVKGEYIKIYLENHTPLIDTLGNPLIDDSWCIVNGKQVVDF